MKNSSRSAHPSKVLGVTLVSLALAMLACTLDVGGPESPYDPIALDPDAAAYVRETWRSALENAGENGQITVILDEVQLTGFISERMQDDDRPLLEDPQVFLRDGSIQVYGTAERAFLQGTILVVVKPEVTPDGEIRFELSEAALGPVPAPEALRDALSALLNEAFTGSLGSLATGIRVSSLAIGDGEMAVTGELR